MSDPEMAPVGFSFENVQRNAHIQAQGFGGFHVKKTGTTICGVVYAEGVVLGADTRATEGSVVADKNCEKIHYIAPNIYCCGAGTSADTENVTRMISSQLALLSYADNGAQPRMTTAMTMLKRHLFKYQGHVSAALVLGGVDIDGPALYTIHPHGSTDRLPFVTMGSGSLAAMSIFEADYKDNMTRDEAVELVRRAINAGIFNDLGSGSNVDVCVIGPGGKAEVRRGFEKPNERQFRSAKGFAYPRGTTKVLSTVDRPVVRLEVVAESSSSVLARMED